jgi:peptidase M49-like protein
MRITILLFTALTLGLFSCASTTPEPDPKMSDIQERLAKYTTVKLEADLSVLTEKERQMIPILKDAAAVMDELFWLQNYGDKITLLAGIEDEGSKAFARINYGPWDWLANNEPFIEGASPKPLGSNFYPADITKEEFEEAVAASSDGGAALKSLYTVVRRDTEGKLAARPYHLAFKPLVDAASRKLMDAAALAEDPGLKKYLELRAVALRDDDYFASDMAWMDMKSNTLDIVIGPIETYEDQLFGYKAGYEAYILIKDKEWSARLEKYAAFLPELQRGLPVPDAYKSETPGSDADLNAYDVIYYAGHCNMGSKTIAINLPNDERVQLEKGARRLQLKNAMRAKFDKILTPIASIVIAEDQRQHITFDAFFANTMFHEVAHGLGIKNTITGKGPVRQAMQEHASALEEGKADILGLYMITSLHEKGELGDVNLKDNYVTFLAGLFRSIRFGGASAHAKANLLRFNYFKQAGAFTQDVDGTYRVDFDKMESAVDSLSEKIIRLQGDGDYDGAAAFVAELGTIGATLQSDLDKIASAGIPIDIVFEQ